MFLQVEDKPDLIRDSSNKAILNTNKQLLLDHRRKKEAMKRVLSDSKRIESLEQEITEIKSILTLILGKL